MFYSYFNVSFNDSLSATKTNDNDRYYSTLFGEGCQINIEPSKLISYQH